MYFPKKRRSSIGVIKIPDKLLITAFQRAVATLPPAEVVKITHMLTVVGKHVKIKSPSLRGSLKRLGRNLAKKDVSGRPTNKGHNPKVVSNTEAFNLWFEAACLSSESSNERPERRKMQATPNLPMKSSALKRPPLLPNWWKKRDHCQHVTDFFAWIMN